MSRALLMALALTALTAIAGCAAGEGEGARRDGDGDPIVGPGAQIEGEFGTLPADWELRSPGALDVPVVDEGDEYSDPLGRADGVIDTTRFPKIGFLSDEMIAETLASLPWHAREDGAAPVVHMLETRSAPESVDRIVAAASDGSIPLGGAWQFEARSFRGEAPEALDPGYRFPEPAGGLPSSRHFYEPAAPLAYGTRYDPLAEPGARLALLDEHVLPSTQNPFDIRALISDADWDALFPMRKGSPLHAEFASHRGDASAVTPDAEGNVVERPYAALDNLQAAISYLSDKVVFVEHRVEPSTGEPIGYAPRFAYYSKALGDFYVITAHPDFDAEWNLNKPMQATVVDYSHFLNVGGADDRLRALAMLLAHASQETTGKNPASPEQYYTAPGGNTPGGDWTWGLWDIEEGSLLTSNVDNAGGYGSSDDPRYQQRGNNSYHGRGVHQLSYPYNYGPFAELVFGDALVLLQRPWLLAEDGVLGFMSAIWFYMTPQAPKPSMHEVVSGLWQPDAADVAANRLAGFGATVMIINGGIECGTGGLEQPQVFSRIQHYLRYTEILGVDAGENLGCASMGSF